MIRRETTSGRAIILLCALATCLQMPVGAQPAPPVSLSLPETAGGFIGRRLPRVAYRGGPFLRHPRIATITFNGDDPYLVSRLEQFGDTITRTRWWREVTEGYCAEPGDCIGEGRPGTHMRLDNRLPVAARDTDVEALLAREAKAGRFGPPDPDTLLLVYLPGAVTLSDAFVPRYCSGAGRVPTTARSGSVRKR